MITQRVVLVKDLEYVKDNVKFTIKKGTEVLVDITNNIALVGTEHMDIHPTEYKMLFFH